LGYEVLFEGEPIMGSYETGQAVSLSIPTKMHRNAFENPLVLIGEGDSLHAKMTVKDGGDALSIFKDNMKPEDEVIFVYKVHQVRKRADIEAAAQQKYAEEKGFESIETMEAEQEFIKNNAAQKLALLEESIDEIKANSSNFPRMEGTNMHYIIHEKGQGATLKAGDIAYVHFILKLADGKTILDNTLAQVDRFVYPIGTHQNLIPAWQKAFEILREGSEVSFWVPSELAYGEEGSLPRVPQNANLAWYVNVRKVRTTE
jgi:FKBP-type peptidyl-prolyl cis-trans isomerase